MTGVYPLDQNVSVNIADGQSVTNLVLRPPLSGKFDRVGTFRADLPVTRVIQPYLDAID